MRIIVTGSSGFIGTNLVEYFINSGVDVLGLDIAPPMNDCHIDYFNLCDIRDLPTLTDIVVSFCPDYIIHMAARTDLNGKTLDYYNSNIVGVENICRVSSKLSSLKKVFFASSMLVCENGYIPSTVMDFKTSTLYGESKAIGEKIVRQWRGELPDFVIARPTSIWGPWFRTPYRDFFDLVLSGKFVDIGPKLTCKTYGYVGNTVHQIVSLILTNRNCQDELIYLGDNIPVDIRQWAFDICKFSGKKMPIRVPYISICMLAYLGDFLKKINVSFPMTSFRLKNMTTPNVIDCGFISSLNQFKACDYDGALINTLRWINENKGVK